MNEIIKTAFWLGVMDYYKLDSIFPMGNNNTYFDIDDGIEIDGIAGWARGMPFSVTLTDPIVIPITKIGDDTSPDLVPIPFNDQNMCICSPEILKAMLLCKVDNIQAYPAILRDTVTENEYPYFAINIVGLVKPERPEQFVMVNDSQRYYNAELMASSQKSESLHIARHYENKEIVISEKLKGALQDFPFLTFQKI